MKGVRGMRAWARFLPMGAGLLGLAAAAFLFARHDPARILRLVAFAGFGMLWLVPVRLAAITASAEGWRALFLKPTTVSLALLTWLAFVRNAINTLLPVAHVGGEVAAVRSLMGRGVPASIAIAGIVVEITVSLFAQMGFTLLGIGLLLSYVGTAPLIQRLWWGLALAVPVGLVFVLLQCRSRPFTRLHRALSRLSSASGMTARDAQAVDDRLVALYGRFGALMRCTFWQVVSLLGGACEFWVILWLLHEPASPRLALLLESLTQALQSAAFMVPGALGVQEGGLILIGAAAGFSADTALAISAVRRVRQIGLSLPVLWVWLHGERKRRLAPVDPSFR
ncbi:MAG: lysylphosphatidylglycerol synthase domain-containing protein [Acidiferrobacter sp.]